MITKKTETNFIFMSQGFNRRGKCKTGNPT